MSNCHEFCYTVRAAHFPSRLFIFSTWAALYLNTCSTVSQWEVVCFVAAFKPAVVPVVFPGVDPAGVFDFCCLPGPYWFWELLLYCWTLPGPDLDSCFLTTGLTSSTVCLILDCVTTEIWIVDSIFSNLWQLILFPLIIPHLVTALTLFFFLLQTTDATRSKQIKFSFFANKPVSFYHPAPGWVLGSGLLFKKRI